ncbi:hypothetical protein [Streptomyces canus]
MRTSRSSGKEQDINLVLLDIRRVCGGSNGVAAPCHRSAAVEAA